MANPGEGEAIALPCPCRPTHLGAPVDAAVLNRAAVERLRARTNAAGEVDCLIVPGFTPRLLWRSRALHPRADDSCARAAADLAAGVADVVIASGGAVHGPANEAVLMRAALLGHGVPEERILVEPCARHTTTNLRNAGRLMLAHGLRTALVVAPDAADARRFGLQSYYVGYPTASSFHLRCLVTLGYRVGELRWVRPHHVYFAPSERCRRDSLIPRLEGDP